MRLSWTDLAALSKWKRLSRRYCLVAPTSQGPAVLQRQPVASDESVGSKFRLFDSELVGVDAQQIADKYSVRVWLLQISSGVEVVAHQSCCSPHTPQGLVVQGS
jgi:hypothetical protein